MSNFLKQEEARKLLTALTKESFYQKQSDLFQFKQTNDLASTRNSDLKLFRDFLKSSQFIHYLEKITKTKLKRNSIDIAGALYEDTDFLLCHDDKLERRKIAFIYYLSTLKKEEGGSLNLFESKKQKNRLEPTKSTVSIRPVFNTFVCFKVCPESFHEVEEVMGTAKRYALSGWFHG